MSFLSRQEPRLHSFCKRFARFIYALLPIILLILATIVGALMFHAIEGPSELKRHLLWLRFSPKYKFRWIAAQRQMRWDYAGALVYAMSTYTTVGFPYRYPVTTRARSVSVIYFILTFPLYVWSVFVIGRALASLLIRLIALLRSLASKLLAKSPFGSKPSETQSSNNDHAFPFFLVLPLLWLLYLLIGAAILLAVDLHEVREPISIEEARRRRFTGSTPIIDTYADALWFTFLAVSTVGLRDGATRRPATELTGLFLAIGGAILAAATLHAFIRHLHAILDTLRSAVTDRYVIGVNAASHDAPSDDKYLQMPYDDDAEIKEALDAIVDSKLSCYDRMLYRMFLSRQNVMPHWSRYSSCRPRSIQTVESSFESRLYDYKRTNAAKTEVPVSNAMTGSFISDENSLVAAVDLSPSAKSVQRAQTKAFDKVLQQYPQSIQQSF